MADDAPHSVNPSALSIEDAVRLLTRAGGRAVSADHLQADVAAGAPTSADGTLNLVHYAAWLVQQMSTRN